MSAKKACWNCGNYAAFYRRGGYAFYKTDKGNCTVKNEVIEKNFCCEKWRNTCTLRSQRKELTLRKLNDVLAEIVAIRQILEEDDERREKNPNHCEV